MNVERIRELAALIRSVEPEKFDMSDYIHTTNHDAPIGEAIHACGSFACIAGWACIMATPEQRWIDVCEHTEAASYLGLTPDQARQLFLPAINIVPDYRSVTREQAAEVLEHLAETGEVVW